MKGLSCGFIAPCFRKVPEAALVLLRLLQMGRGVGVSPGLWCCFGDYGMRRAWRGGKGPKSWPWEGAGCGLGPGAATLRGMRGEGRQCSGGCREKGL